MAQCDEGEIPVIRANARRFEMLDRVEAKVSFRSRLRCCCWYKMGNARKTRSRSTRRLFEKRLAGRFSNAFLPH